VTKYKGAEADLAGAFLAGAPLRGAGLGEAKLQHAFLYKAHVRGANRSLCCRDLADRLGAGADLEGENGFWTCAHCVHGGAALEVAWQCLSSTDQASRWRALAIARMVHR
jgi:hypothetical protein